MKILLTDIDNKSKHRPIGYKEDVLSNGTIEGKYLIIDPRRYMELLDKYSKTNRVIPNGKECCNKKKMPPLTTQVKNATKAVGRIINTIANGDPIFLDDDGVNKRFEICKQCEKYSNGRCSDCGCFLKYKLKIRSEECPDYKWGQELINK